MTLLLSSSTNHLICQSKADFTLQIYFHNYAPKHPCNPKSLSVLIIVFVLLNYLNFCTVTYLFPQRSKVEAVRMPYKDKYTAAGRKCNVTGWGALQSDGEYPEVLQKVQVPIVSDQGKKVGGN